MHERAGTHSKNVVHKLVDFQFHDDHYFWLSHDEPHRDELAAHDQWSIVDAGVEWKTLSALSTSLLEFKLCGHVLMPPFQVGVNDPHRELISIAALNRNMACAKLAMVLARASQALR